jgi:RimJ/RimL family protein N-acetyltransferase
MDKATDEYLGWCGLKYSADLNEYDIGFRFFKRYWNKGYATEAAHACLKLGFEKFNMQTIVGRAMKQNSGSIRVLQKLGMTYTGTFDFDKHEGQLYSLTHKEYLTQLPRQ